MESKCNACSLKSNDNAIEMLLMQIKREISKLKDDTTARLLAQDGKIAEACVYIRDNLSNSIRCLLDSMQLSGELDDIITQTLLSDLAYNMERVDDILAENVIITNNEEELKDATEELTSLINEGHRRITLVGDFIINDVIVPNDLTIHIYGSVTATNGGKAFYLKDSTRATIEGGYIYGDEATDNQEVILLENATYCTIRNVTIAKCRNKGISLIGASTYNTIEGCVVSGCVSTTGAGISLYQENVKHNIVRSCICNGNRIGITVNGSHYNHFTDIIANYNTSMGVTVDGVVTNAGDGGRFNVFENITANGSMSTSYGGVFIGNGSSYNTFTNVVANNNIGRGIHITNSSGVDCKSNKFVNVTVNENEIGIHISLATETVVNGITSQSNRNRGISIISSDYTKITSGTIKDNTNEGVFIQSGYITLTALDVLSNGKGVIIEYGNIGTAIKPMYSLITGCNFANYGTDCEVLNELHFNRVVDCTGFVTHNFGVIEKEHNQTIAHGLSKIPRFITLTPSIADHICTVAEVDETTFTIRLFDAEGYGVDVPEKIYWEARC